MTKTEILSNLYTYVKEKIGLIDKVELSSVHEDLIDEVYSEVLLDSNVTEVHTETNSIGITYNLSIKKTGNFVYISGLVSNIGINPTLPVILIKDSLLYPKNESIFHSVAVYYDTVAGEHKSVSVSVVEVGKSLYFGANLKPEATYTFSIGYTTN